jgi:acyl-coenzyme A thioesterase PaaI-like protein
MSTMTADELQVFLDQAFPAPPTGYVVERAGPWGADIRLSVTDRHGRPGGTVSGPTLMALADCTAWLAILAQIGPVALAVTTSLHIDFLRKPPISDILAHGRLLKLGSRLAVVDVELGSVELDEPVAKAQVTYSIPPQ